MPTVPNSPFYPALHKATVGVLPPASIPSTVTGLIRYDAMVLAIAACERVDEVKTYDPRTPEGKEILSRLDRLEATHVKRGCPPDMEIVLEKLLGLGFRADVAEMQAAITVAEEIQRKGEAGA